MQLWAAGQPGLTRRAWRLTLIIFECYLLLSLNVAGIFAHGLPQQRAIRNHSEDHSHYDNQNARGSNQNKRQTSASIPRFSPEEFSRRVGSPDADEALRVSLGAEVDTIDLAAIENKPEPRDKGYRNIQPVRHPLMNPLLNDPSIDRFDAFGDYDYIEKPQYPTRPQVIRPLRFRPSRNPFGPPITSHFRQPVRRKDTGFRKPAPWGQTTLQDTFIQRPQRPQSGQRYPRPTADPLNRVPVPINLQHGPPRPLPRPPTKPGGGFGVANSILNWVGLEATPFVKSEPTKEPIYHEVNPELDAEYYADYNDPDIQYPPRRPPTVTDRVFKWFEGFKPPSARPKPNPQRIQQEPLDYSDYSVGDDHNLVFYNELDGGVNGFLEPFKKPNSEESYSWLDVVNAIRNNETRTEVFKKALGAAASLSERSSSSPVYMMWTIPTTIFAVMGIVYFVSALAILGYQFTLGTGSTNAILPTLIALSIPLILGFIFVTTRASVNGDINMEQVVRGDFRQAMRSNFDGVDFTLDALFGSASILGVAWLASIVI